MSFRPPPKKKRLSRETGRPQSGMDVSHLSPWRGHSCWTDPFGRDSETQWRHPQIQGAENNQRFSVNVKETILKKVGEDASCFPLFNEIVTTLFSLT